MKTTLFLMEQLIAILIFAVCGAVCVSLFASAHERSVDGSRLNNSLIIAKNAVECFKAASGDLSAAANYLNGNVSGEPAVLLAYYDEDRLPCEKSGASYVLRLTETPGPEFSETLSFCQLSVETADGVEIYALDTAARKEKGGGSSVSKR